MSVPLEIRGVAKRFGEIVALQPTSLHLPAGQTSVLIGSSGSGKSTVLRLLIGLITPDEGSVRFDDVDLAPDNVDALRHRMGYVIQDGGLFPHIDARGNASLLARHLGWDVARIEARLAELSDLTQLPFEALDRFPAQLSGGQQQRVSLMRALMLDPDVLLLDEPLGSLDPMIRAELQTDLRAIFRRLRKTVVLVTHDVGEAAYFGDRVALLAEGRVVQDGTMRDLIERPADPFVSQFIRAQRRLALDGEGDA